MFFIIISLSVKLKGGTSFKVTPLRYNKLIPAFFPVLQTLLKRAFWYRQQLLFRFFFYLLNRRKIFSFHRCLFFFFGKLWPFLNKFGLSLNAANISSAMSMRRYFCSIFSNFGTIFAEARFMFQCANMIRNLSNSNSTIIRNYFLHSLDIFIGCWHTRPTRMSSAVDIFCAFLKPVIRQLKLWRRYKLAADKSSFDGKSHSIGRLT